MKKIFIILFSIALSGCQPASALTGTELDRLALKIIQAESSGHRFAVGKDGERGLMQIKHDDWMELSEYGWDKAFEPGENVQVGRHLLEVINEHYLRNSPQHATAPRIIYTYNTGRFCYRKHLPHWTLKHPNEIYRSIFKREKK